ncbi:AAA family ATPase [Spongisporangium articulatum]|uniref:AAA family ATPase n=1 Tax=Spongisporangium articulatum TaxID=3362603 RepID=A0ABW8ASQ0_9ACTN
MTALTAGPRELEYVAQATGAICDSIETVIEGKRDVIELAVTVLLAEGHLLVEDVPGVGKTMLAKSLAKAIGSKSRRIQFTPDLLPSDVTGVSIYRPELREFEFKPGAVFTNVVIGDEINRASPKTQSALLECMEERQVTADGVTHPLEPPFIVVATQNPIEMEGTYPLPEAQRDRFMARVSMGYPAPAAEMDMLEHHAGRDPLGQLAPASDAATVQAMIQIAQAVYAADAIKDYVVQIVRATRETPLLRLGASPRAALHLLRAAKARAAIGGRGHVLPDDVQSLAAAVLAHRLLPSTDGSIARRSALDVVGDLLQQVPVPQARAVV